MDAVAAVKNIGSRVRSLVPESEKPELEQASLRVLIGGVVLAYLAWYTSLDRRPTTTEIEVLCVAIAFFCFAVAVLLRIVSDKRTSIVRRYVGVVADNAVTSYCLFRIGEGGAVILGVYLFVAFGNGFRFGRSYLHASQALGLIGYSLVLYLSPFWSQHLAIGIGFLIAMIVLPFYVAHLAERLKEARKKADDANQAKGRFLANVSHEMRTPLNGVIAMADMLRETPLTAPQSEIVETLSTSAHLLLAQVEDVLDMAKIEAGRIHIESRPFELRRLLNTTLSVVLPQARYKGLFFQTMVSPETERWYSGDSHHLRQILLNLLANAVKFTDNGGVTLRVTTSGSPVSPVIRFEVEDTGIGIPLDKQDAIFEAFAQADDSITRVYGGTGLGTTIAKQLVTLMGGTIGVNSAIGSGSLFWFEIPLSFCDPSQIQSAEFREETAKATSAGLGLGHLGQGKLARLRGARVLVAEDNETNRKVTKLVLESGGHLPTIVTSGEAALDELERGTYDIALFDLSMPLISGLEALRIYRFTTRTQIPVIILSANVTPEIIGECKRAGAAEFVAKPARASVLLEAIDRHLIRSNAIPVRPNQPTDAQNRPALTLVEVPVVDENTLAELERLSNDPTFLDRFFDGFRSDAERLIGQLGEALTSRKFEEVRDLAHALKGAAGSVGAKQLVSLALRCEKAGKDDLAADMATRRDQLATCLERTLAVLDERLVARRKVRS